MRKTIVYTLCAAMLGALLCGCGYRSQGQDDMAVGTPAVPEMTPMISPVPTPDPEDGVVGDRDGIIEEGDAVRGGTASGDGKTARPAVSPSPAVTGKP